jgi:LysR family transcriptional regulator, hydrogen peroxide-inducible genes activator
MNMSGLSLRDLEYVVAVADHGSFVKAAEQCHVAQPSLSVQVSKLEARLRTVIFERTTRRIIVTRRVKNLSSRCAVSYSRPERSLLSLANRNNPLAGRCDCPRSRLWVPMCSPAYFVISVSGTLNYR